MKEPIIKYSRSIFENIKYRLSDKFSFKENIYTSENNCYCVLFSSNNTISNIYIDDIILDKYDVVSTVDEFVDKIIIYANLNSSSFKIIPPEGMEIFIEGKNIKFRPIKEKLKYTDIAKELFLNKDSFYIGNYAKIGNWKAEREGDCYYGTLCSNKEQAEKLININKLINTANYFNNKCSDQEILEEKDSYYYFSLSNSKLIIKKEKLKENIVSLIRFHTRKAAEETLKVLGEDLIINILK